MFYDIALLYDPKTRRCDLMIGDDGDLVIDETPITPVLLSVGLDRRAAPDDPLPEGRTQFLVQSGIDARRGSAVDALDPYGDRIGSRLWLLDRAKETETTRLLFSSWLTECLEWAKRETGIPAEIDVQWLGQEILGWRVLVDDTQITGRRAA